MFNSQETNEPTIPYQERREPTPPPVTRRRRGGCFRAGAITASVLLLVVVFGIGMFAGWEVGRGNAATPASTATVPALTGTTLETVREVVVAKVEPAVVEVNVATSSGKALGSGVQAS